MKSLADNKILSKTPCEISFDGGKLSSDAGCLLISDFMVRTALEKLIRTTWERFLGKQMRKHTAADILMQKVYMHIAGYHTDDAADHLAKDPAFQLMLGKDRLASQPTASRFNAKLDEKTLYVLRYIQQLLRVAAYSVERPQEVMLDVDTTILETYGAQEGGEFIHHYDAVGYHPIIVYDSNTGDIIRVELRNGKHYCGKDASTFISPVLEEYKTQYPDAKITVRGDSGFAMPDLYDTIDEYSQASYVIRLKKNSVLEGMVSHEINCLMEQAASDTEGETLVCYGEFRYKAGNWSKERRVAYKLTKKTDELFVEPMFVVTDKENLTPQEAIELYCKRGSMENLIKESKNSFGFRNMSSHTLIVNDNLLQVAAIANNIFNLFRRLCLIGKWRKMQAETIRLKLLKIAGRMVRHGRKIKMHLSSSCQYKGVFWKAKEQIMVVRQLSLSHLEHFITRLYEPNVLMT